MRVKDKRKFLRFLFILGLLIFTISCGMKKFVMKNEEEPQMVKEEIQVDTLSKATTPVEVPQKKDEVIKEDKKEVVEVATKKEIKKSVDIPKKEYFFIKNNVLYVYSDDNQTKKIDSVRKGTRVELLDTKEVKNGETTKNVNKIRYKKDLKVKEGWIGDVTFAKNLNETLPSKWGNLDFENTYPLKNYENNPRIDVKGVYLNIYSIGSEKKLAKLIKLANDTEINAFVIDVKDDNGVLAFQMEAPKKFGVPVTKNYPIKDINAFMKKMKENKIYTIARIVSFKDPTYAKANPDKAIIKRDTGKPYTNSDGIIWVSAHDRKLWDYNVSVAEEAAKVGFNEIQFDYVRFPASNGGKLDSKLNYRNTQNESKPETIQKYLKYAKKRLDPLQVYISADVYGQVGTFKDDMGLGQHWETVSQVVDYISPMMYPSHYGKGAYGIAVPDAKPYETIYYSLKDSINRNENIDNPSIIRPWIQDFTATWVKGYIRYREKEVREQIKAMNDLGVKEYLLWSPSNNYNISRAEK